MKKQCQDDQHFSNINNEGYCAACSKEQPKEDWEERFDKLEVVYKQDGLSSASKPAISLMNLTDIERMVIKQFIQDLLDKQREEIREGDDAIARLFKPGEVFKLKNEAIQEYKQEIIEWAKNNLADKEISNGYYNAMADLIGFIEHPNSKNKINN